MVLAVVVTRVSHSGSRGNTCVMLEEAEEDHVNKLGKELRECLK